jgi:hypothetical protein
MFRLPTEKRLRVWREFRSGLENLEPVEFFQKVSEFWSDAPFVPYYLDIDDVDQWPNPWLLIEENIYCDIARCLGMLYTIHLTQRGTLLDLEFRCYQDPETKYIYNLAWIDEGKYILNLMDREVVNIEQFNKNLTLKKRYTSVDLGLQNY